MKIGFIGTGHMASSIALSINNDKDIFLLNNRTLSKAEDLKNKMGNNSKISSLEELLEESDYIFLGVKPSDLTSLLKQVKESSFDGVIISMVAGFNIEEIEKILKNPIIRIMPNTPVIVGKGVTFVCYNELVSQRQIDKFIEFYKPTGKIFEIEEDKFNLASTLVGSGPAYVDYFLDALIKASMKMGFSEEEATQYALFMCEGTISLNLSSSKSPLELGKEVCSPGGSTIAGITNLISNDFYDIVYEALLATYNKNSRLK